MTCEEVERDEVAEQYVAGRLSEDDQARFEDHFFDCTACLERVRIVEQARAELSAQEHPMVWRNWRRAGAGLAAAAVLALAVRAGYDRWIDSDDASPVAGRPPDVIGPSPSASTSPAPIVQPSLGKIELPPYNAPRVRTAPTDAQRAFRDAMVFYSAGNCDATLSGLRRALVLDDSLLPARFYLGVCELERSRPLAAAPALEQVIAAGESPYLEDALFFLAHARIREGNLAAARAGLERVVSLRGNRRDEAQRLLTQLP